MALICVYIVNIIYFSSDKLITRFPWYVIKIKILFWHTIDFYNIVLVAVLLSIVCWDIAKDAGWVVCCESVAVWEAGMSTVL